MCFLLQLHLKKSLAQFVQALRFAMTVRCVVFAMDMLGVLACFGLNYPCHASVVKCVVSPLHLTMD